MTISTSAPPHTRSPTISSTLNSPTTSPVSIPVLPSDQLAWDLFRNSFPDSKYCLGKIACTACPPSQVGEHRKIVCEPMNVSSTFGLRRLDQVMYSIVEIRLRNSNLSGVLNASIIGEFRSLKLIDLSNTGSANENKITYFDFCFPLQECFTTLQCFFPSTFPQLCQNSIPYYIIIISVLILLLMILISIYFYIHYQRRRKQQQQQSKQSKNADPRELSYSIFDHVKAEVQNQGVRQTISNKINRTFYPKSADELRRQQINDAWEESYDYQSGSRYYVNMITGEFSWTSPLDEDDKTEKTKRTGFPKSKRGVNNPAFEGNEELDEGSEENDIFQSKSIRKTFADNLRARFHKKENWEEIYDEETDTSYFVNTETGEFSRNKPDAKSLNSFPLYIHRVDESGTQYWNELDSGKIVYTKPTNGTVIPPLLVEKYRKDDAEPKRIGKLREIPTELNTLRNKMKRTERKRDNQDGTITPFQNLHSGMMAPRVTINNNNMSNLEELDVSSDNPLFSGESKGNTLSDLPELSSENPLLDRDWQKVETGALTYWVDKKTKRISRKNPHQ